MKTRQRGFTLEELLIVVAIIAVLVAIGIPVFTGQLEKSRESTDLANVRSAYAEVLSDAITAGRGASSWDEATGVYRSTVTLKQQMDGWTLNPAKLEIGGVAHGTAQWVGEPGVGGSCVVSFDPATELVTLTRSGGSGGSGGGSGSSDPITIHTPLTDAMKSAATPINDIDYSQSGQPRIYTGTSSHLDSNGSTPVAGVVYNRNGTYYQVGSDSSLGGNAWYKWNESAQAWEKTYF